MCFQFTASAVDILCDTVYFSPTVSLQQAFFATVDILCDAVSFSLTVDSAEVIVIEGSVGV